jgi:pimeloyl-ACP methyl ester carboxylesterase
MSTSQLPTCHYPLLNTERRLAFSQVGHVDSPCVLLCLPGLLETRATFDALLQAAEGMHGLRVISLDHCGRGDSDPLPGDKGYSMQVYLDDIVQFLRHEVMLADKPIPRLEVLGTSMGGLLAMYLAHDPRNAVQGLFFNDIGLNLQWLSIYGLYDGMKKAGRMPEPQELATQLNVTLGAVLAVRMPTHFDLPYRKDWKGMQFGHLLNDFKGLVRLVHGSESGVCLSQQVKELQHEFPKAQVLEVAGASHPVPFTSVVNQFVLTALKLPAAPSMKPSPGPLIEPVREAPEQLAMPLDVPVVTPVAEPLPEPVVVPVAAVSTVEVASAPAPSTDKARLSWLSWLKQQLLNATKK